MFMERYFDDGYVKSVLLVKGARSKEVNMDALDHKEKKKVLEAMAREWRVYQEFRATAPLKAEELTNLMRRKPPPRIIDTRWAHH